MVLASFGLDIAEATLRTLCDCTMFGTEALKAVDAVRQLGFVQTTKQTLSMEELTLQVRRQGFPIAFVSTLPLDGQRGAHAVVVIDVDQSHVTVADPLYGERIVPHTTFTTAWAMMHNLTILIQR